MSRANSNFRTNLLDRIGGKRSVVGPGQSLSSSGSVDAPRELLDDSFINPDGADLQKLRLFVFKNNIPSEQRIYIWKLLLGVASPIWAAKEEVEEHRKEEAQLLFKSLEIMMKLPTRKLPQLRVTFPDIVHMIRVADPLVAYQNLGRASTPSDLALFCITERVYKLCNVTNKPEAWTDAYWLAAKMYSIVKHELNKPNALREAVRNVREQLYMMETEPSDEKKASSFTDSFSYNNEYLAECSSTFPCGEVDRESPKPFHFAHYRSQAFERQGSVLRKSSGPQHTSSYTAAVVRSRCYTSPLKSNSRFDVRRSANFDVTLREKMAGRHRLTKEQLEAPSSCCTDVTGDKARAKLIAKMRVLEQQRYSKSVDQVFKRNSQSCEKELSSFKTSTEDELVDKGQIEIHENELFEGSSDEDEGEDKHETSQEISDASADENEDESSIHSEQTAISDFFQQDEEELLEYHEFSEEPERRRQFSQKSTDSRKIRIMPICSPDHPGASMEVHHSHVESTPILAQYIPHPLYDEISSLPRYDDSLLSRYSSDEDLHPEFADSVATESSGNRTKSPSPESKKGDAGSGPPSLSDANDNDPESRKVSLPISADEPRKSPKVRASDSRLRAPLGVYTNMAPEIFDGEVDVNDFCQNLTPKYDSLGAPTPQRCASVFNTPMNTPIPFRQNRRLKWKFSPFGGLSDDHIALWFLCGGTRYLSDESTYRMWDKMCAGESVILLLTTVLVDLLEYALEKWMVVNENLDYQITSVFPVNRYISPEVELKIVAKSIESVYRDRKGPSVRSEEK
ncbi:hypothetical protein L596_006486 [Steinernema carpocapsae]|uniref:Uncharacterized protein n=1 Tax=Steinernema carpocapsae TaxID=34508 RepID=A0A4U8V276_STECR|nr:hypothetical protein L596_006486 [Steinernema carpocapsae]